MAIRKPCASNEELLDDDDEGKAAARVVVVGAVVVGRVGKTGAGVNGETVAVGGPCVRMA